MNGSPPPINAYGQPPRRTGWVVYAVIISFFCIISFFANFCLLALLVGSHHAGTDSKHQQYEEQYVMGDEDSRNKIVEIDLTGVIGFNAGDEDSNGGMVNDLKEQIKQAVNDRHVKAIVLRINSPGGEVVASDAIYRALAAARGGKSNSSPAIVSCIETVGASGAYYAAMGTDYIVANELSITASIGVIMQTLNFGPYEDKDSLMHKLGVKSFTFKSGKLKDILNPARAPTEEETTLVKNLIMEVYEKFVGIVAKERNMDVDELKNGLADGRILSGKQAKEAGLIDQVGYFEDAVQAAKDLAKITNARVVRYSQPFSLRNVLRIFGKTEIPKIEIQLTPNTLKLQSGKMYLLPAYMFQ
jgi:protease-4